MIEYLRGELVELTPTVAVIDCNGVGYATSISLNTYSAIQGKKNCKLYIYEAIREDAYVLYGFADRQERELFLLLISVSGIGPRVALSILSGIRLSDLAVAIKTGDTKLLSTIKGLGKKTAERIVLELKDKISVVGLSHEQFEEPLNESMIDEATEALISLGINKNEAYRLARENSSMCQTTEEIIRKVFQNLG